MTTGEPRLCCDAEQVDTFADQMDLPRELLARCPSCFRNFAELWCQSTCAPNQREFLKVWRPTLQSEDEEKKGWNL